LEKLEFEAKNNPVEVTKQKIKEDEIIGFDPLKHSTVFFGHSYTKVNPDDPRFFNVILIINYTLKLTFGFK
jgi:hypothetical protein